MRGAMSSKKHDPVNFPSHYNKGGIGCIDAIKSCQGDGFKYYLQGSAIKYIWRHEHKGKPLEDFCLIYTSDAADKTIL